MSDRFIHLPEQGRIAQLTAGGRQVLWTRSGYGDVWKPNDTALDRWWALVRKGQR